MCLPPDAIRKDNINIGVDPVHHVLEIQVVGYFYLDFAFIDICISTSISLSHYVGTLFLFILRKEDLVVFPYFVLPLYIGFLSHVVIWVQCYCHRNDILMMLF